MALELQALDLISIFTTHQPITGIGLKDHCLPVTLLHSAFRAQEVEPGHHLYIISSGKI